MKRGMTLADRDKGAFARRCDLPRGGQRCLDEGLVALDADDLRPQRDVAVERGWALEHHVKVGGHSARRLVDTPGRHGIAVALGGADGCTLFMLTSETLGDGEQSRARRTARIETCAVTIPGCESP